MMAKRGTEDGAWGPPAKVAKFGGEANASAEVDALFSELATPWAEDAVEEPVQNEEVVPYVPDPAALADAAMPKGKGKGKGEKGKGKSKGPRDWEDTLQPGSEPPEGLAFGYVKETRPEKGFSFLVTDPNDESTTVYVHKSVCDPSLLEKAEAVAYKTHFNRKGEAQASAPVWLLVGPVAEESVVSWCDHVGVVKVTDESGSYIECEAVKGKHGQDAFCDAAVTSKCGLREGETIRFDVEVNEQGVPQVKAPVWKLNTDKFNESASRSPEVIQIPDGAQIIGTVKMTAPQKGFGFFLSPQVGDQSIFVSANIADLNSLSAGDTVAFTMAPETERSKEGSPEASGPVYKLVGQHKRWDGSEAEATLGQFVGEIGKILPNGSAFITSEGATAAYERDSYIHAEVVNQCGVWSGDIICFDVHVNSRSMPQVSAPCWKLMTPGVGGSGKKGGKGKKGDFFGKGKGGKADWGGGWKGKGDSWGGGGGGWGGDDGWSSGGDSWGSSGGGWGDDSGGLLGMAAMLLGMKGKGDFGKGDFGKGKGKWKGDFGKGWGGKSGTMALGNGGEDWGSSSWGGSKGGVAGGVPAAFAAKKAAPAGGAEGGAEDWL